MKCPIFLSGFNKIWIKMSSIKFHESLFSESQVDTCAQIDEQMETWGHTCPSQ